MTNKDDKEWILKTGILAIAFAFAGIWLSAQCHRTSADTLEIKADNGSTQVLENLYFTGGEAIATSVTVNSNPQVAVFYKNHTVTLTPIGMEKMVITDRKTVDALWSCFCSLLACHHNPPWEKTDAKSK